MFRRFLQFCPHIMCTYKERIRFENEFQFYGGQDENIEICSKGFGNWMLFVDFWYDSVAFPVAVWKKADDRIVGEYETDIFRRKSHLHGKGRV